MSDDTSPLMPDNPDIIVLGQEARGFLSSPFGCYLMERAAREAGAAAKELCVVDPTDTKRIMKLQEEARKLKDLERWINEAIAAAEAEYASYKQKIVSEG